MIKKHYSDLVNRRNVFTGKAYRDDDACALAAAMHAVPRMPAYTADLFSTLEGLHSCGPIYAAGLGVSTCWHSC